MGAAPVCRPLELRPARVGPPCSHHLPPVGQAGRSAGARFVAITVCVYVCLCSHCLGFVFFCCCCCCPFDTKRCLVTRLQEVPCNGSFCLASYGSRFGWDFLKVFFIFYFCNNAEELAALAGDESSWSSDTDSGYFLTIERRWPDPSLKVAFFRFQLSPICLVMVAWFHGLHYDSKNTGHFLKQLPCCSKR